MNTSKIGAVYEKVKGDNDNQCFFTYGQVC